LIAGSWVNISVPIDVGVAIDEATPTIGGGTIAFSNGATLNDYINDDQWDINT
jgi:hypothetical protein